MASSARVSAGLIAVLALVLSLLVAVVPCARAQDLAPAPAPTSDGTSIDQGIACLLMLVALVLTYLIHPLEGFSF